MNKPLTKFEKFICEMTWGCIPVDIDFIRNSKLFQSKLKETKFINLYKEYENKN